MLAVRKAERIAKEETEARVKAATKFASPLASPRVGSGASQKQPTLHARKALWRLAAGHEHRSSAPSTHTSASQPTSFLPPLPADTTAELQRALAGAQAEEERLKALLERQKDELQSLRASASVQSSPRVTIVEPTERIKAGPMPDAATATANWRMALGDLLQMEASFARLRKRCEQLQRDNVKLKNEVGGDFKKGLCQRGTRAGPRLTGRFSSAFASTFFLTTHIQHCLRSFHQLEASRLGNDEAAGDTRLTDALAALEDVVNEREELKEKLGATEAERDRVRTGNDSSELTELKERLRAAEAERDRLRADGASEREQLQERLKAAEAERDRLRAERDALQATADASREVWHGPACMGEEGAAYCAAVIPPPPRNILAPPYPKCLFSLS
jgi:DNA repair exonuclease SbcCD ATPase subunit